jgi:hypothetical protein
MKHFLFQRRQYRVGVEEGTDYGYDPDWNLTWLDEMHDLLLASVFPRRDSGFPLRWCWRHGPLTC